MSFPEEGDARTDARTHARRNNQLRAQPSGEMHENKSAASAASPDFVKFQAVIKSAASAASRKPKSREGSSRGVQDDASAGGRRPRGTPLEVPSLDLGFPEAALAAYLITA